MKEATGELNMTVITVVAIAAVAAFFYAFVWPSIKVSVMNNQCVAECGADNFTKATRETVDGAGGNDAWVCTCNSTSRNNVRQ